MVDFNGIWNRLTKIHPPPFITINSSVSNRKKVLKRWSTVSEPTYDENSELLKTEFKILDGFIERKGTQLRLEKAQMITNLICKTAQRWISNDFTSNFSNFDSALQGDKVESPRLPTLQWNSWIKYVALRETALLAKIKQECEKATQFWLGLISSSFHWGDSLVITGALSRIWYLSSVMLESLIYSIYPSVISLDSILEPNTSGKWPSDNFSFPLDLQEFLICLKMPFSQSQLKLNFNLDENVESKGLLKKTFKGSTKRKIPNSQTKANAKLPKFVTNAYKMNDNEDLGIVVQKKTKKGRNQAQVPNRKGAIQPTVKIQRKKKTHWENLFWNHKEKMKSIKGRKKLIVKIRNCLAAESDSKIQLKLKRLRKSIKESSNDDLKAIPSLIKFENFIKKRLKNV